MKKFFIAGIALMMVSIQFSCSGQAAQKQSGTESEIASQVGIYYFHFTRRCATCIAVEENSKRAVEELYPEQVKTGEYFFKGINLDEESSKDIAKELGVGMQTLLVVHGDKKIDITGEGFMYAQEYEKLKAEIEKAVDKALKE
jgi:hypothetical protein